MPSHVTLFRLTSNRLLFSSGLLLGVVACSSTPLYEKTDIHYIQECSGTQKSCAEVLQQLTQRCQSEHSGQLIQHEILKPNRLHILCRPAPEEKPSTGTPKPEADTPDAQRALLQSSPQGQEAALDPEK